MRSERARATAETPGSRRMTGDTARGRPGGGIAGGKEALSRVWTGQASGSASLCGWHQPPPRRAAERHPAGRRVAGVWSLLGPSTSLPGAGNHWQVLRLRGATRPRRCCSRSLRCLSRVHRHRRRSNLSRTSANRLHRLLNMSDRLPPGAVARATQWVDTRSRRLSLSRDLFHAALLRMQASIRLPVAIPVPDFTCRSIPKASVTRPSSRRRPTRSWRRTPTVSSCSRTRPSELPARTAQAEQVRTTRQGDPGATAVVLIEGAQRSASRLGT